MQIERDIIIEVGDYEMNIKGIVNALLSFLTKIFETYLPEKLKDFE